jgi:hypothetical protein
MPLQTSNTTLLAVLALMLALAPVAFAAEAAEAADAPEEFHPLHPPIGVSAGHTLASGHVAIGYAYSTDRFKGLRSQARRLSPTRFIARSGYSSASTNFKIERHEFAFMYAPSHRVTAMLEVPYVKKEMRNVTAASSYVTRAEGLGDIKLTGIARFMENDKQRLYFSTELGIPTGQISKRDDTSPSGDERLPYPMQLGSGVWHLKPGLTYQGHSWRYTWGGQVMTLFRLGDNGSGYTPGNVYEVSGWVARRWHDLFSTSLRVRYKAWGNTSGTDPRIDSTFTPVAEPMRQRGERLDVISGLDVHLPFAPNQSLAIEVGVPVVEWLDGPQPSADWNLRVGWRWAF